MVSATEKNAIAAVIASRGCSSDLPKRAAPHRGSRTPAERKHIARLQHSPAEGPYAVQRRTVREIANRHRSHSRLPLVCARMLLQQSRRRLGRRVAQHLQARRTAPRIRQQLAAGAALGQMRSNSSWSAAESVPSSASASMASHCAQCPLSPPIAGVLSPNCRIRVAELFALCHLNHLPFYTLQKPRKFPAPAADPALHRALRNPQDLRDLLVIHIFQVAEDHRLAQFRRELGQRLLNARLQLQPCGMRLLRGPGSASRSARRRAAVSDPPSSWRPASPGALQPRSPEVVHQQVARQRGNPGLEAALLRVEAGQVAIELQEDVLRQVLGVRGRAGEAVADAHKCAGAARPQAAARPAGRPPCTGEPDVPSASCAAWWPPLIGVRCNIASYSAGRSPRRKCEESEPMAEVYRLASNPGRRREPAVRRAASGA